MYGRTAHRLLRGGDRLLLRLDDMLQPQVNVFCSESESESQSNTSLAVCIKAWGQRLVAKPAWTLDCGLDSGLDRGLDFGLDFELDFGLHLFSVFGEAVY